MIKIPCIPTNAGNLSTKYNILGLYDALPDAAETVEVDEKLIKGLDIFPNFS